MHPFIYLLQEVGIREQNAPKQFVRIKQSIRVEDGDKVGGIPPYRNGFKMDLGSISSIRCLKAATSVACWTSPAAPLRERDQPCPYLRLHA